MKAGLLKLASGGGRGWRHWTSRAGHEVRFEGGYSSRLIVRSGNSPRTLPITPETRRRARLAAFDLINLKQASGIVHAPIALDMDISQRSRKAS